MPEVDANGRCCLVCGTALTGNRAREHVFPRWLIDELHLRGIRITPVHQSADGVPISMREHTLEELVEGRVCAECNNGWMNQLEQSARPVLESLMRSDQDVADLDDCHRLILARWTCKTCWMLNSASNFRSIVPVEHIRALRSDCGSLPNGVVVAAGQHQSDRTFFWMQAQLWIADVPDEMKDELKDLAERSYKISIQLRDLLLLTAWWPAQDWLYGAHEDDHHLLWYDREVYRHAQDSWLHRGSARALFDFHASIVVAEPTMKPSSQS